MISVIITTHNGRKDFCRKAIQSVIDQTYDDWELIVVDDASRDGTSEMVKEFKDTRIKYKRRTKSLKNQGPVKNDGIKMSKGEYIAFLDSDNTYRPDHLNVLIRELERNPEVAMVYGDRWIVDENGEDAGGVGRFHDFNIDLLMGSFAEGKGNYIDTSDVLVRRQALYDVGGWDERYKRMLDWNLWVRMVKFGHIFKRVPAIITNYTVHKGSISTEKQDLVAPLTPPWNPVDVEIQLPYLGSIQEPSIAVFSITYERLEYTKLCFESLYHKAGVSFSHFIVDNGSTDGTQEWLENPDPMGATWCMPESRTLIFNKENRGISIASNQAINAIFKGDVPSLPGSRINYDIIVKVDNDCLFLTDG